MCTIFSLTGWQPWSPGMASTVSGPRALRGEFFVVDNEPTDTYFDFGCAQCQDWQHGAVFINGFNIGRFVMIEIRRKMK